MIKCNFVDERGCSIDTYVKGIEVVKDGQVHITDTSGTEWTVPQGAIYDIVVTEEEYLEEYYGEYASSYDHTFIMQDRTYADGTHTLECVGWVYGDETDRPEKTLMEMAKECGLKAVLGE